MKDTWGIQLVVYGFEDSSKVTADFFEPFTWVVRRKGEPKLRGVGTHREGRISITFVSRSVRGCNDLIDALFSKLGGEEAVKAKVELASGRLTLVRLWLPIDDPDTSKDGAISEENVRRLALIRAHLGFFVFSREHDSSLGIDGHNEI